MKVTGVFVTSIQPENSALQSPSLLVIPKVFIPGFLQTENPIVKILTTSVL
jgi:hypothetical protein